MNKFGEPWSVENLDVVSNVEDAETGDKELVIPFRLSMPYRDRIVDCVNACAGMDDPEGEIKALKKLAEVHAEGGRK